MNKIEQVCHRHKVKAPQQIIFEIESFGIDFDESDMLDFLEKIQSNDDRIIYLEELANLTKSDWESGVKELAITRLHDLSNQYLLDYRKLQHGESLKRTETIKPNHTDAIQIGRPEDFPSKKTLQWYKELKVLEDYQHKNGKPHKFQIKTEIIRRHGELHVDGHEPSMDTINTQFRKLGLTR